MTPTAPYRRDIDGLRALAILPVLAFHAKISGFTGGFVGVDIFFVISGFLITGIIAREVDGGTFSLVRFYERRARRILPALLVMIAAVLVLAAWFYLPDDFAAVPRSALMTLIFLANVWFFTKTGYFGGPAETMPLLHCWSLAVEEQFYVVFPLVLWICAKLAPKRRWQIIALLAALSFGWAWLKQADTDGFAFYLLPTRAWEMMAGSLLALAAPVQASGRTLRQLLALAGLALIGWSVATYDRGTVFPGLAALPPVLGASLLIRYAPGTLAGRVLSAAPLVWVGLISYSLYLWHWPLIVFAEYRLDRMLDGADQAAIVIGSFIAAWASWRFVERPFRDHRRINQRAIFAYSAAGMAAVAAVSLAMLPLGGWSARFSPQVIALSGAVNDISPKRDGCVLVDEAGATQQECVLGAAVPPTAALWGDSHGIELAWALGQKFGDEGRALVQHTRASCPPVMGYQIANDPACARSNGRVMQRLLAQPQVRTVYLVGFWASPTYRTSNMQDLIDETIAQLQDAGKQVVLIGPVPSQSFDVPRRLAQAAAQGKLEAVQGVSLLHYRRETTWFTRNYRRWENRGVAVIDPLAILAHGDRTRLMLDNKPLYFDSHHLSVTGAQAVVSLVKLAP
ncbi:acetylase [Novosphingobium sp. AAP83]|uniref:acyltransferase family protein n=1 Tax=Novosphingobium sp. AAP83 TaxID=1523425 RepID=UPI0006B8CFDE|nr:acyltransferase family protein [Novosphingobium sp. AAP83]KPF94084.1 acetylase [Novosphingobium sp. AAP83]